MAETVHLNDGSTEVILTDTDVFLERLIREKLGDDAARCFTAYIAELKEILTYQEESTSEQERSADGYLAMCHEAVDNFSVVLKLLEAPRLDRKALKNAAQIGHDALYKNL